MCNFVSLQYIVVTQGSNNEGCLKFHACIQVPNGELNSEQLRFLGDSVKKYGEKGCLDITTRANIQLRGIPLEDAGPVFEGLQGVGLSSVQTGKTKLSYPAVQLCST